jgi:TonB-linked SusC/RagA family outer membrane protein
MTLGIAFVTWAQDRVVTGKVTAAEDGSSLPGVNVVLKGTTNGTVTDSEGTYKLSIPASGGSLIFSFIGLQTQEVAIGGRSAVDVALSLDVQQLTEVVVTAQGVQQEKRALGYAVSSVSSSLIEQRPEADIGRILNGKVPGMNITPTGGVSGSGTNIIIRGYNTISGNKQPLFIVDGVPFNSSTNNQNNFLGGNQATSSRFLDLDPNNIERVDVLKGLSASVLYGEQGRNGVILITTKNSTKKSRPAEFTIQQSYFVNEIASAPVLQNNWGNGFDQNFGFFFSNWGPNFNTRGAAGIAADGTIPHPYSRFSDATLLAAFPEFQGVTEPYQPYDNNRFFRRGSASNTSVNVNGGTDKLNYNVTVGRNAEEGFVPNNTLDKLNFGLGVNASLSKKFSVGASFNYAQTDMSTPPISAATSSGPAGDGASVFANVFYTPRSVDLMGLPFESPIDNRSVYYRSGNDITNPRWIAKYMRQDNNVKRTFGKTSIVYDASDELSFTYRVGLDTYSEDQAYIINRGSTESATTNGLMRTTNIQNTIVNHDFFGTWNKDITEDLNLNFTLGGQARFDRYDQVGIESTNQVVFGFENHNNFLFHSNSNSFSGQNMNFKREENYYGAYGRATLGFKDYLYAELQGRNDWKSTAEAANNSIFYPSASVSFIPTTALGIESNTLNFMKVRVGYGTSAGFPPAYSTRNFAVLTPRRFQDVNSTLVSTNAASSFLANPDLRPELHTEVEFGLETRLFKNRLSADITYYRRNTEDLITEAPIDPSVGVTLTAINIGRISNNGIEIALSGTPLQVGNFKWDATVNFFHYESFVEELGAGLNQVVVSGFSNEGNFAIAGQPFNIIQGTYFERDANGNRIVSGGGRYLVSSDIRPIGDPNPDFTSSLINTFSYKGVSLSFQFDYRKGGDILSATAYTLLGRGITKDTDFDRTQPIVLPGVKQDGSPNDIQVTPSDAYFGNFVTGASEAGIFDGTTVRLREVSLSYALPKSVISKTPFKAVSISLVGNNLWFNAVNFPKYLNFDTDVLSLGVGNGLGFDYFTGPSARRYGANLRITF